MHESCRCSRIGSGIGSGFGIVVGVVLLLANAATAVPPANGKGVIQDLQAQIDDLQAQIDDNQGLATRASAVDGSAQTVFSTNQPFANPEAFISFSVTTTVEGTFVMGFTSRTQPAGCTIGSSGNCDDIAIIQRIYLDGQQIGSAVRSSRIHEPGGDLDKYVTWTASAEDVPAGSHTIEVRVACTIPFTPTAISCETEGHVAASMIDTLWAMHPE